VTPRYDTRDGAIILKQIADRIGTGKFFPYENMEELVKWQLKGTGFKMEDFEKKGFVAYGKKQIFWDRKDGLKFKTPSGKIEFKSSLLEDAGFESFPAYESVPSPSDDKFRLVVGRNALHTHVSTQNNPYLNDLCGENELWINDQRAADLGISDGDTVRITSKVGSGEIKAKVTDLIHPEAVYMLHGFGHTANLAERSFGKGLSDAVLQENITDKIGGSPALHDTFVSVEPV
jgi:thiosulfate reductase/polysulfide reductase chain A